MRWAEGGLTCERGGGREKREREREKKKSGGSLKSLHAKTPPPLHNPHHGHLNFPIFLCVAKIKDTISRKRYVKTERILLLSVNLKTTFLKMKPVAVDEMFPEGSGPYVDLDEVIFVIFIVDLQFYMYLWLD